MAINKGSNQKDILIGSIDDDVLIGYGGNDILYGDAGNDLLSGGFGDDVLIGGDGNDLLNGGRGIDVLFGGKGNDFYVIDNSGDKIYESIDEGIDTVRSSITWSLEGLYVENLVLTGIAAIDGTGNSLNNKLIGNEVNNRLNGGDGNDLLIGGRGVDTLIGGAGNDSLRVDDFNFSYGIFGDVIDGGTGIDNLQITALIGLTLDLRKASIQNIEIIRLNDSYNTLIVDDLASIIDPRSGTGTLKIDASGTNNKLKMVTGWTDEGIVSGYHTFTKGGANLLVDIAITGIQILPESTAYTISDVATANNVGSVFDDNEQIITIDFGGKQ